MSLGTPGHVVGLVEGSGDQPAPVDVEAVVRQVDAGMEATGRWAAEGPEPMGRPTTHPARGRVDG